LYNHLVALQLGHKQTKFQPNICELILLDNITKYSNYNYSNSMMARKIQRIIVPTCYQTAQSPVMTHVQLTIYLIHTLALSR